MGVSKQAGNSVVAIILVIVFIAVGAIAGIQFTRQQPTPSSTPNTGSESSDGLVDSTATTSLVYASRYRDGVMIRQVNADGTNNIPAAKLPENIRDINLLDKKTVAYIGNTSSKDGQFGRGLTIEVADISAETITSRKVYELSKFDGWAIDELIVSPDKKFIAWWEIKSPPNVVDHSQYAARTYIMPLDGGRKVLVSETDETVNAKVKPLFFDASNRLYADTVEQNPYNFYLGIKRYSTTGALIDTALANNTFNSWPKVSPDGRYAVYTTFDGTEPYAAGDSAGITRTSNINPNRLMLWDLTTNQRRVVGDRADNTFYDSHISWSFDNNGFLFNKDTVTDFGPPVVRQAAGLFHYDLTTNSTAMVKGGSTTPVGAKREIPVALDSGENVAYFGTTGEPGNLSGSVSAPTVDAIKKQSPGGAEQVVATGPGIEIIDIIQKSPSDKIGLDVPVETIEKKNKQLRLTSFEMPVPPPPRVTQGRNPRSDCVNEWQQKGYLSYEMCEMCPLYLYPTHKTGVAVKINNAQIAWSSVPSEQNGFSVTAYPDGKIEDLHGVTYNRIDYNYLTSDVPAPTKGLIIGITEVQDKLFHYAKQLGLNDTEANDFVVFWADRLPASPYYFVSHYDKETMAKKLTLDIAPKPDTFIQVMMYFKPLAAPIAVESPVFATIPNRVGFVAVDFSGRIDQ